MSTRRCRFQTLVGWSPSNRTWLQKLGLEDDLRAVGVTYGFDGRHPTNAWNWHHSVDKDLGGEGCSNAVHRGGEGGAALLVTAWHDHEKDASRNERGKRDEGESSASEAETQGEKR